MIIRQGGEHTPTARHLQPIATPHIRTWQKKRFQVNYTFMKKLLLTTFALLALALTTQAERIVVLTSGNRLVTIDSAEPGTATATVTVTGLGSGASLVGIDFRPGTGGFYGVGDGGRL